MCIIYGAISFVEPIPFLWLIVCVIDRIVKNLKRRGSLKKMRKKRKNNDYKIFHILLVTLKFTDKFSNDTYLHISFLHFLRAKPITYKFCYCLETKCLWNIHLRKWREKKKIIYIVCARVCMYVCMCVCLMCVVCDEGYICQCINAKIYIFNWECNSDHTHSLCR